MLAPKQFESYREDNRFEVKTANGLLHNAFVKILSQVDPNMFLRSFCNDLLHIMLDHQLYQLFKAGLCGIPAGFFLRLTRIVPEVYHIGGTVEIR